MAWGLRREHRDQLFQETPALPEDLERLIEQEAMLVLLDEDGVQCRVEIAAIAETRRLHRGDRVEHRAGAERHARLAQRAGEIDDVLHERATAGGPRFGLDVHHPVDLSLSGTAERLLDLENRRCIGALDPAQSKRLRV